jgi:putative Mg2+ transporter-C (MgtC) family protein
MSIQLQLDLCLRVLIATLLSMLIGFERERSGQSAGLRTHMLVGLGAAMFTVLSIFAFPGPGSDSSRVAAQIVTGIGFLGAGAIIQRRDARHPHGLTTAAGIWAVAAVGMACGAGAYVLAAFATLLMVVVLGALARLSDKINPGTNADRDSDANQGDADELHRKTGGKEQQTR